MTRAEFAEIIDGIGLPWCYYQFDLTDGEAPPVPPYIVYFYPSSNDMYADGLNYQKINGTMVELYTKTKDFALEDSIEAALTSAGLSWSKEENYIESERLYMVAYDLEVLING